MGNYKSYSSYQLKLRHSLSFILFLCLFPGFVQANLSIRVIDESAIPYMDFLPRKAFDQRFPGQVKSDMADLEKGWYVIYIHQSLNYYFGPILLESTGQDYLARLAKIVEAAVEQRPTIKDFQLVLNYEPSTEWSENTGKSNQSGSDSKRSSDAGNGEQSEEAQQPSGFWGIIRRIFGF